MYYQNAEEEPVDLRESPLIDAVSSGEVSLAHGGRAGSKLEETKTWRPLPRCASPDG